eukprot:TRINITY_DN2317_c0_g2_i2.p1 TRINITY_DN2317_c0_g2~~TRINITY_DN2317_c0_g2_i2.p1  ORF type:complete len:105 (-),score=9.21 TRINITY_DN2317_c0_g2_i2:379-693(-)
MEAQHEIIFVTGNAKKVEELNQIMGDSGLKITPQSVDLPELQGEPEEIAKSKCKLAYSQVNIRFTLAKCTGQKTCYYRRYISLLQCSEGSSRTLHQILFGEIRT